MGVHNRNRDKGESIAVVVLNWRRYEETRGCLAAAVLLERPARLYLVDNETDPDELARLRGHYPRVTVLPQEENLGFAEGMNAGMDRALDDGATHILLLNNDARVTPPLLDRLVAIFRAQEDAGIVGPSIRFLDPGGRVESAGLDVNRFSGRIRLRGHGDSPGDLYPYPHKVDAVPGTAMMVSAEMIRTVGMFDPGYFTYFEDVDLCLRARRKGFSSYVVPKAVVHHAGAATLGPRPERIYYAVRNHLWVVDEHGMELSPALRALRRAHVTGLHVAQAVRQRRVGMRTALLSVARGVRDHHAGQFGRRDWRSRLPS